MYVKKRMMKGKAFNMDRGQLMKDLAGQAKDWNFTEEQGKDADEFLLKD